jgi:hypothetical protein
VNKIVDWVNTKKTPGQIGIALEEHGVPVRNLSKQIGIKHVLKMFYLGNTISKSAVRSPPSKKFHTSLPLLNELINC